MYTHAHTRYTRPPYSSGLESRLGVNQPLAILQSDWAALLSAAVQILYKRVTRPPPPPRWERVPGSAQLGQTLFKVWVSLESTPITIRILISVDLRLGLVRETNMYILVAISLDPRPSFLVVRLTVIKAKTRPGIEAR